MASLLAVNVGSSSFKYAVFDEKQPLVRTGGGNLPVTVPAEPGKFWQIFINGFVQKFGRFDAIGHRIVHGGPRFSDVTRVTPELLDDLRRIAPFDPDHLPAQIECIEGCRVACPEALQVACFDTAFHKDLPRVSRILPIPRKYEEQGIRRYGFHGLSFAYVVRELGLNGGGRAVLAHLGSGSSLAAVHKGKCIDTTMAFSPASGIPMSSRSGDLDPGIAAYLAKTEGMTPERFFRMATRESGLLGISGASADMRQLLKREADDPACAEAVAVFCTAVKKTIGACAAALGGIDTLVFSGGIGENSDVVRQRICDGLGFLGIELDPAWNAEHKPIISKGTVTVRVIKTDEEVEIARSTWDILRRGHGGAR